MKDIVRFDNHDNSVVFGYYVLHGKLCVLTVLKSSAPFPLSEIENYLNPIMLVNFKFHHIYNFVQTMHVGFNTEFFDLEDCLEELKIILQGFSLEGVNG